MDEHSFHEREGFADNSGVQRLSESRPKFKPVLVKKLLADESDDDSDDQAPNSDNSDEESDNFDSFQPLPEESSNNQASNNSAAKSDSNVDASRNNEGVAATAGSTTLTKGNSGMDVENIELGNSESEPKSVVNTYLKDTLKVSEYVKKKFEEERMSLDRASCAAKRKSCKELTDRESIAIQSQWQSKNFTILDKRKSLSFKEQSDSNVKPNSHSPDSKRHSQNVVVNQTNEVKDKSNQYFADVKDNQEPRRYSSASQNKILGMHNEANEDNAVPLKVQTDNTNCSTSQSKLNTTLGVMDTPMKQPQTSARPIPCHSHRNIFQTPQNKSSNEFPKNPIQTPATIFSHWSQHHLAQTPMQKPIPTTRESMQTPISAIVQSQTPRYFGGENKGVRRPLAEAMYASSTHGTQLSRLQEVPNESQPSPLISRESTNAVAEESVPEIKPVYSSSHVIHETKENRNPNTHDTVKSESHGNTQLKAPVTDIKHPVSVHGDSKPKVEYHNNAYNKPQVPKAVENYDNYQVRESQSVHPPVKTQPEKMQTIQCSIPQQTNAWNSRQNKIITVKDRQYLVLGVLGQGMSCEVVRAQDLSTSELRAIKCVNLNKFDKDSAQGCLQEICMLDKLKAPCIVHMYNFEIKQPWVHVVMEIGDTDLSRLLKSMLHEKKQIPLTMILYYWTEMLTAVKHIHKNGVIHSDLKPANFLLVRGRLKLIDFGIASNINSDMTSVVKNCPIGTLNYISPEALMDVNAGSTDSPNHNEKFKISYKSDVWSLGCILYGLVYGVTPFNHIRQQWAKISAITDPKHKINFPLMTGSEPVPLILIDVMRKCLQHDPKARPTVADLLEIPYLQSNITPSVVPSIPSNILMKIKNALSEDEWKKFSEVLENKRKR